MNEILRFMQKRDEQMDDCTDGLTDGRTHIRKVFYNLPTTAFGRRQEINILRKKMAILYRCVTQGLHCSFYLLIFCIDINRDVSALLFTIL